MFSHISMSSGVIEHPRVTKPCLTTCDHMCIGQTIVRYISLHGNLQSSIFGCTLHNHWMNHLGSRRDLPLTWVDSALFAPATSFTQLPVRDPFSSDEGYI